MNIALDNIDKQFNNRRHDLISIQNNESLIKKNVPLAKSRQIFRKTSKGENSSIKRIFGPLSLSTLNQKKIPMKKMTNSKEEYINLIKEKEELTKVITDYENKKKEYIDKYLEWKKQEIEQQNLIEKTKSDMEVKKKELDIKENEINELNLKLRELYNEEKEKKEEIKKSPLNQKDFIAEKLEIASGQSQRKNKKYKN